MLCGWCLATHVEAHAQRRVGCNDQTSLRTIPKKWCEIVLMRNHPNSSNYQACHPMPIAVFPAWRRIFGFLTLLAQAGRIWAVVALQAAGFPLRYRGLLIGNWFHIHVDNPKGNLSYSLFHGPISTWKVSPVGTWEKKVVQNLSL